MQNWLLWVESKCNRLEIDWCKRKLEYSRNVCSCEGNIYKNWMFDDVKQLTIPCCYRWIHAHESDSLITIFNIHAVVMNLLYSPFINAPWHTVHLMIINKLSLSLFSDARNAIYSWTSCRYLRAVTGGCRRLPTPFHRRYLSPPSSSVLRLHHLYSLPVLWPFLAFLSLSD